MPIRSKHRTQFNIQVLLIYSPNNSSRFNYTVSVLFGSEVLITQDRSVYAAHPDAKMNYSDTRFSDGDFQIIPHSLLQEKNIVSQNIQCFKWQELPAFFKTEGAGVPFDIFAASFYLLSRYEEYLPHDPDEFGRYAHTNSAAFQNGFLHLPLIQLWIQKLEIALRQYFPSYTIDAGKFKFVPTYDIDIAYCYLHQPAWKNILGFYRDFLKARFELFVERAKVYTGNQEDPYDQYAWLDTIHKKYSLEPIYFFLLAHKRRGVDKNIHPTKKAIRQLIKAHAQQYAIGIHPSWQSGNGAAILKKEINALSEIINLPVQISRQHYLRMSLPYTYQQLIAAGIRKDYTMGYGCINGFRASYALPYKWFDLTSETITDLEIHPFCYMDANAIFKQRYAPYEAKKELQELYDAVKKVNGEMITIFHNNFLTDQIECIEWKKMYADFLAENTGQQQ